MTYKHIKRELIILVKLNHMYNIFTENFIRVTTELFFHHLEFIGHGLCGPRQDTELHPGLLPLLRTEGPRSWSWW